MPGPQTRWHRYRYLPERWPSPTSPFLTQLSTSGRAELKSWDVGTLGWSPPLNLVG